MAIESDHGIPDDALSQVFDAIWMLLTEEWPVIDEQQVINLAVVVDNIYHGFDESGQPQPGSLRS